MLFCNIDILDDQLEHKKDMFVGVQGAHITYIGSEEPADAAAYGQVCAAEEA